MSDALLNIAQSFAEEYCSNAVYPAHLFKAVLHKDVGLVKFVEVELDKDYYYLQDWADVQMQLAPRAVRPMRNLELSDEAQNVMDEADEYKLKFGLDETNAVCILAAAFWRLCFAQPMLKAVSWMVVESTARMVRFLNRCGSPG